MGGTRGNHNAQEKYTEFRWVSVKERNNLKVMGGNGMIILNRILNKYNGSGLIHLARNREERWAVLRMVIKLRTLYNAGNFSTR